MVSSPSNISYDTPSGANDDPNGFLYGAAEALLGLSKSDIQIIPLVKTVPTDIRRQYALMLANVLNSSDYDLIQSFWMNFSAQRPRLKKVHEIIGSAIIPRGIIFDGIDSIVAYWCSILQVAPDTVIRISDVKIISGKDSSRGGTIVTATVFVQSTIMYQINPSALAEYFIRNRKLLANNHDCFPKSLDAKSKAGMKRPVDCAFSPTEPLRFYAAATGALPPMVPHPLSLTINGKMSFYLDDLHKIQLFHSRDVVTHKPLIGADPN